MINLEVKPTPMSHSLGEKCDVILVAGGRGHRFKGELPKQFEPVHGRPLYLWSLDVFLSWSRVGSVVVVVPPDWVEPVNASFGILNKEIHVVAGGSSRQLSTQKGLRHLSKVSNGDWVMIHDAARPAIGEGLLERLWSARLIEANQNLVSSTGAENPRAIAGVIPGIPAYETIKKIQRQGSVTVVSQTLPRHELVIVQTPQLLKRKLLVEIFEEGLVELDAVDDASLLEKRGLKIVVVDGDYDNVKVTFKEDKDRVSSWLRKRYP